jgi:Coenzyme PQQ synthesis protein D (PqqD)
MEHIAPVARSSGLVVQELEDEIFVFDITRNKAHSLNRTSALIWKQCDGRTTVGDMAEALGRELGAPVDEQVVWYALGQLKEDHLLEEHAEVPFVERPMSRRHMMRTLGIAAAVPVVATLVAPVAASAATCIPSGGACSDKIRCCSSLGCNNGGHCH